MITPVKINDERLQSTMSRIRAGRTQQFFNKENNRHQKPDIIIDPPSQELFAKLIDDEWYWVSGCEECNGTEPANIYIKCIKHDVCVSCSIPRTELTHVPWGHTKGFLCKPCADAQDLQEKKEAFRKIKELGYDEFDYHDTDSVICPHCGDDQGTDDMYISGDLECSLCGGSFHMEFEAVPSFTTKVIGKRLLS